MSTSKMLLIFVAVGAALWAASGFIVNMGCFVPVYMLEGIKPDQELARQTMAAWSVIGRNVLASWAIAGALMGFVTLVLFMCRPSHEHYARTPSVGPRPAFMPMGPGPKTMAEVKVTFFVAVIGGVLGALMAVYLLPHFELPGMIVVKGVKMRVVLGGIQCLIVTVLILPFSLGIATRIERGC